MKPKPTPPNLRWRVYVGCERRCRVAFPAAEVADADQAAARVRAIMPHFAGTTLRVEQLTSNGVKTTMHAPAEAAA